MASNYIPFVVIAGGRTGSTMLVRALNSSAHIRCFGEVFNAAVDFVPFGVEGFDDFRASERALRDRNSAAFLAARVFGDAPSAVRASGFKLLYGQERRVEGLMQALLEIDGLHMLHLRRRNYLRTAVSLKIAETTGVWVQGEQNVVAMSNALRAARHPLRAASALAKRFRVRGSSGPAARAPVTLTRKECTDVFDFIETQEVFYENAFEAHPRWTLYYEDIMERPEREYRQVLMFLGLDPEDLSITTRKQNPEPLRELVANYDELRQAFAGSRYAAFFD